MSTSTVVVSVRVKKRVKDELEKAGINISEVIKNYLEELAWRIKVEETLKKWDKLLEETKPSQPGFASRSVREDRDSR